MQIYLCDFCAGKIMTLKWTQIRCSFFQSNLTPRWLENHLFHMTEQETIFIWIFLKCSVFLVKYAFSAYRSRAYTSTKMKNATQPRSCYMALEQRKHKNDSMESKHMLVLKFAALFPSPYSRGKKSGNFKTNMLVDSMVTFLYCLSSRFILGVKFYQLANVIPL